MIPLSTDYALVVEGIVVAVGSAKKMRALRKRTSGSTVYLSPGRKIGDRIK